MKNCYVYLRVSTDEQANEGFSLDNQKRSCLDYAQMCGYHVKKVFEDGGRSGKTTDRPAFQELLALIQENSVDAVIIYKIDRFARNVGDFSNIRKQFKQLGIKLLSVSENGDVTEGLIGNIFASVAEWESEVNGQRTKDALMQKFREGWQPTPPPIGYISIGGDRERKTCEPDPYVAPIIKELYELYATGNYSILELQEWLSDKNLISKTGTGLGHSVICNILNNPFYYGLIRWRGESKIGKHIPIITRELFDTCQYVLAKHRNFLLRRRTHNFLLRGFIYCAECGQRYTAEWHKNEHKFKHRGGKIGYYHCIKLGRNGCPAPYVEISELEKLVEKEFKNMQFSQEFIDAVVRKTRERLENNRKSANAVKQGMLNQKTALETKRNKLEDALLDATIDRDTFKRKHTEIHDKILNLEAQIQETDAQSQIDIDLIDEVLAFTRNIYQTYKDAPTYLKRHYLRFFYEKLIVRNKEVVEAVPTPIFLSLQANQAVIITAFSSPALKLL
ncbi:recombinase family protein [Candidatus Daviesbacteria bacterium]|nr:recombinase family protein [Candidatus Daviesbacteria bacterium]